MWFVLAGVIGGIVAGMGLGGGTLLIPILTIFLQITQINAQKINLFVFLPMAIISILIHCKNNLIDFKTGIPIMISGAISTIPAVILANNINNDTLKKLFGYFLLCIGLWQIIQSIFNFRKKEPCKKGLFKFTILFK